MESGLEDRNNQSLPIQDGARPLVSMESGLEDRNNAPEGSFLRVGTPSLNGVRPRRPEQYSQLTVLFAFFHKSQWSPA